MIVRRSIVLHCAILAAITACSESANFRPPTPRVLPHYVVLPGLATLRMGEALRNWPFPRKRLDELSVSGLNTDSSAVYEVELSPRDSVERVWVTAKSNRIGCVIMRRNQSYYAAFDSLSRMFQGIAPTWKDSSGALIQAAWSDGHVAWWVSGTWYAQGRPTFISVKMVSPVGEPFESTMVKPC